MNKINKPEFINVNPNAQCPYTGKMYDGIRTFKQPCTCDCHKDSSMMHCFPCCNNGLEEVVEYRYV